MFPFTLTLYASSVDMNMELGRRQSYPFGGRFLLGFGISSSYQSFILDVINAIRRKYFPGSDRCQLCSSEHELLK